jgi:hypothetical protein
MTFREMTAVLLCHDFLLYSMQIMQYITDNMHPKLIYEIERKKINYLNYEITCLLSSVHCRDCYSNGTAVDRTEYN